MVPGARITRAPADAAAAIHFDPWRSKGRLRGCVVGQCDELKLLALTGFVILAKLEFVLPTRRPELDAPAGQPRRVVPAARL